MKPMKSIQRTIIPFDYPACFNEWSRHIQNEIDANRGLQIAKKELTEDLIMEALVDQAYEILIFNAKRN